MRSRKLKPHFVPCIGCKGRIFLKKQNAYWVRPEDDAELIYIPMLLLICKTCKFISYYAQEYDIINALEPLEQDIYN